MEQSSIDESKLHPLLQNPTSIPELKLDTFQGDFERLSKYSGIPLNGIDTKNPHFKVFAAFLKEIDSIDPNLLDSVPSSDLASSSSIITLEELKQRAKLISSTSPPKSYLHLSKYSKNQFYCIPRSMMDGLSQASKDPRK
ncbi:hypothetical protein HMI55_006827 [Coelomomyces lativittatus]|nr:hypothetical protein HMI55_006827 [Coelomomyces lativittatus]